MKKRIPRFERKPEEIGKIILQQRDIGIIKLVNDYRFMSSDQIQALVEGSNQVILRRLQKLFHHGFLDRPVSQIIFSNPLMGHHKMVYGLGDRGADVLAERFGMDRGKIRWKEKNKEARERYIQHTLMISHFRACLTLALKGVDETQIGFWVRENPQELKDSVYVRDSGGTRRRVPIVPDGFFEIDDPRGSMYFFVEADRSTMANARFLRKMRAYWDWWRQRGHEKKFGIGSFRVLTITKTRQRKENLREVTKKADDRQIGSLIFWFASEENYSLKEPENILKKIWQTPRDDEWHSILE